MASLVDTLLSNAPSTLSLSVRDSYLTQSFNQVLACEQVSGQTDQFSVVLDDSVLYAEGGGQPFDLGTVNGIPVLGVFKAPAEFPPTSVRAVLSAPLEVGSTVESKVDWARRYDHMQQHTSQHLLSAVAYKRFGADTVGWSLTPQAVTVDLQVAEGDPLSAEQIQQLEVFVNEEIRRGTSVSWRIQPRGCEITDEHARGTVKGAATEVAELRLVTIAGLDTNPCGGTHLLSLQEIQMLKIIGFERDRSAIRVRYLAGDRVLRHLQQSLQRDSALANLLSVPTTSFVESVTKLINDKRDSEKYIKAISAEVSGFIGQSIASELSQAAEGEDRIVVMHRHGADLAFLLALADAVNAALTATNSTWPFLLFVSGDDLPATANNEVKKESKKSSKGAAASAAAAGGAGGENNSAKIKGGIGLTGGNSVVGGPFVLMGPREIVDKLKDELCTLLGGRGGGRPGRLQGQATNISRANLEAIRGLLSTNIRS